jgi:hypothetical protein
MKPRMFAALAGLLGVCLAAMPARAWDYSGHRAVNLVALHTLPKDFPAFVKTPAAKERIAFLAGEADRWRNSQDYTMRHCNEPDHFLDLEYLAGFGLTPETVSPYRYEFVSQLAAARVKKPEIEPVPDPAKDTSRNRALFGLLPWTINEQYSKLKSAFSYLKTFEQHGGTADEIRNAQENIIYLMGVMGHFAGDATQPLHTTKHFNGWLGDNPKGYSTKRTLHSWIDGGYLDKVGLDVAELLPKTRPARGVEGANARNEGVFQPVMGFLVEQNKLVAPLYAADRDGKMSGNGTVGLQGRALLVEQLIKGGQLLGDLWLTAWQTAPEDGYLKSALARRKLKESGK